MGERLRHFEPKRVYFVTNHCVDRMFLMRPDGEANRIVLSWLLYAASRYGVFLHGYVFMSNHFHLLVSGPHLNLATFMQVFQSSVARDLNRLRGRSGPFWRKRYSAIPILDDAEAMQKLVYIMTNPCEADLVNRPEEWPGMSSFEFIVTGEPVEAKWLDKKERRRRKRKKDYNGDAECMVTIQVPLMPLPHLAGLSDAEWQARVKRAVLGEARRLAGRARRRLNGVLGVERILATDPTHRPDKPLEGTPEPLCLTTDPRLREEYRDSWWLCYDRHQTSAQRWRAGKQTKFDFPDGMFPPGWTRPVGAPPFVPVHIPRPWETAPDR